jgi:4-aminobutyrate aminotransferase
MSNAQRMGAYIIRHTADWRRRHRIVGDVRGRGLMVGVEIVHDQTSKERAPDLRNRIIQTAFQKGLLLLGAGENSIRLAPPLMIEEEQTEFAVSTLDACITAVEGKK